MYLSPYKTVVSVEAVSKDMTVVATVKAELGITVTTYDDLLDVLIQHASAACASYCNREFASETVISSFRTPMERGRARPAEALLLDRTPMTAITTVVEDSVALDAAEYEFDAETGFLWKLSSNDTRVWWTGPKLVVTYTGGYVMLTTLPSDLERACIDLVKHRWFSRQRDPLVKAVDVPGVLSEQYWVGGASEGAIPKEISVLLDPYVRIVI
jgi:hypothetical protein